MVYYNDNDPKCVAWLRELVEAGELPDGDIDDRSIEEIVVAESGNRLVHDQAHWFAGIGGWPLALKMAGWPDDRPVWTGSCPCQPFSAAGNRKGTDDERHLWPAWFRLIRECRPQTIFGEQIASNLGLEWLTGVFADLEGEGYWTDAVDLPAACVGAPHIRQRLFWVADRETRRRGEVDSQPRGRTERSAAEGSKRSQHGCGIGRMAEPNGGNTGAEGLQRGGEQRQQPKDGCLVGRVGHAAVSRSQRTTGSSIQRRGERPAGPGPPRGVADAGRDGVRGERPGPTTNSPPRVQGTDGERQRVWADPWTSSAALDCLDGKTRRTQPGIHPLAHGIPGRVGLLRGYGNAIVPQVAAVFVRAFMETAALQDIAEISP